MSHSHLHCYEQVQPPACGLKSHEGRCCLCDEKESCKHEDVTLKKTLTNLHLCISCGGTLVSNEVEILNMLYEMGGFCDSEKCERYLVLVV